VAAIALPIISDRSPGSPLAAVACQATRVAPAATARGPARPQIRDRAGHRRRHRACSLPARELFNLHHSHRYPRIHSMQHRFLIVAALSAVSLTAVAGKLERDTMTKEVLPAIEKAEAKFKSSCGCPLKITVDDSMNTRDLMFQAKHIAEDVGEESAKYCTDAGSKKALCQMKKLEILQRKPCEFTFKDGVGQCTSDGNMRCAWQQITKVLDK
jgi:hypothetical protein